MIRYVYIWNSILTVKRQHFNCNRCNEENLLDFRTVEHLPIYGVHRRKRQWGSTDSGHTILLHSFRSRFMVICIVNRREIWCVDSLRGLESTIIKKQYFPPSWMCRFVIPSRTEATTTNKRCSIGWKYGKSSKKTVLVPSGKMKVFDDGTRKMYMEERIHRCHAAQAVKEEWGAFCWNYTLNYALHSGAVRARETKTWQLKQANA